MLHMPLSRTSLYTALVLDILSITVEIQWEMAGNVLREEVFSRRRCGGLCGRPSSLRRGKPPHTLPPRPRKPTFLGTDICLSPAYPQIAGSLGTNAGSLSSAPAVSRQSLRSSVGDVPVFGPSPAKKAIFACNLRFSGTSPTVWRL